MDDEETTRKFKYTETIANTFDYRGTVDFHNTNRHDDGTKHGLSIEETWRITNWTLRVFLFILTIMEVNSFLARFFWWLKGDKIGVSEEIGL